MYITRYKGVKGVGKTALDAQCNARAAWMFEQQRKELTTVIAEEQSTIIVEVENVQASN